MMYIHFALFSDKISISYDCRRYNKFYLYTRKRKLYNIVLGNPELSSLR